MTTRLVITSMMLALAIGCGRSEQQQAEEAARQIQEGAEAIARGAEQAAQSSSEQMAQGLEQMAKGFQQLAQNQQTKTVAFESIQGLLPQVNGWTQSDARGEELSMPIAMSKAEAQYRRGDARVELSITDSAMSQLILAPLSMFMTSGYSERSSDGFKRATQIGGQPGFEEWNAGSRRGEVTTLVGNRFVVQATGHDVDNLTDVRQLVEAIDLAKLAALK